MERGKKIINHDKNDLDEDHVDEMGIFLAAAKVLMPKNLQQGQMKREEIRY